MSSASLAQRNAKSLEMEKEQGKEVVRHGETEAQPGEEFPHYNLVRVYV